MKDGPLWSRVSRRLWRSTDFRNMGPLPPSAPALWLYLLTGEHRTKVPGLFVLGVGTMSDDLRWPVTAVRKHLKTLVDKKHVRMDDASNVVWLPKAIDHNLPENPNVVIGWKRDWQGIPESSLKAEARKVLRAWFAAMPLPDKSKVTYADAFAVALGERPSTDPPKAPPNVKGKDGGNVTPNVGGDHGGTLGGIEEGEGDVERDHHPPTPSSPTAPIAPLAASTPDPVVVKSPDPVAPTIDPNSTDPTDLLNALANSSGNVFDRLTGAGTDVEVQFQRRLAAYRVTVGRAERIGSILADHAKTIPALRVRVGEKIRMALLMGPPSGQSGQRGGSWLGVAVGILEAREAAEAKRVSQVSVVHQPQPVSEPATPEEFARVRPVFRGPIAVGG